MERGDEGRHVLDKMDPIDQADWSAGAKKFGLSDEMETRVVTFRDLAKGLRTRFDEIAFPTAACTPIAWR